AMALSAPVLPAHAQEDAAQGLVASEADALSPNVADANTPAGDAAEASTLDVAPGADAYTPLGPEWIKGSPESGAFSFQDQYSPEGTFALWFHDAILMPL